MCESNRCAETGTVLGLTTICTCKSNLYLVIASSPNLNKVGFIALFHACLGQVVLWHTNCLSILLKYCCTWWRVRHRIALTSRFNQSLKISLCFESLAAKLSSTRVRSSLQRGCRDVNPGMPTPGQNFGPRLLSNDKILLRNQLS